MLSRNELLITCGILLATAGTSHADDARFYVGGELSLLNRVSYNDANSADLNNFKTSNTAGKLAIQTNEPGINVFAGAQFTPTVGMEAGFGFIQKAQANVQNNGIATNKISNLYLDLLGLLRVSHVVDLVGLVGIGALKSKADVTNATFINLSTLNKIKVGYRIGGGAQYNFSSNWASRAILRYQSGNKDFLRSNLSISIGLQYMF